VRLVLILTVFYLVGCGLSNPFNDDIPYKQRFDEGLLLLKDQFKNLGVQIVKEAASRTAEVAGDGR